MGVLSYCLHVEGNVMPSGGTNDFSHMSNKGEKRVEERRNWQHSPLTKSSPLRNPRHCTYFCLLARGRKDVRGHFGLLWFYLLFLPSQHFHVSACHMRSRIMPLDSPIGPVTQYMSPQSLKIWTEEMFRCAAWTAHVHYEYSAMLARGNRNHSDG